MARVQCPECDELVSSSVRSGSRKITCSACGHKFLPPDDEDEDDNDDDANQSRSGSRRKRDDERPLRNSRRRDDRNSKRKGKKSSVPLAAWIGGGIVAVGLLGIGLYFTLRSEKKKNAPEQTEVVRENSEVKGNDKPTRPNAPNENQALAVGWTVNADPPDRKWDFPDSATKLTVPLDFSQGIIFPTSPSPFFAVGNVTTPTETITLWDIRSKQQAGILRGKTQLQSPVLSPDGKYIAGKSGFKPIVDVYDFATGKTVRDFAPNTMQIRWFDFGANNEELVIAISSTDWLNVLVQTWNLASGTMTRSIVLPKTPVGQPFMALSPGRHLLAVANGENLWVYRLADSQLIGTRPIPELVEKFNTHQHLICEGLAFSPDGSELAGLFKATSNRTEIVAWKIASGKLEVQHEVTEALGNGIGLMDVSNLEYLPDGLGWVVRSNFVIDRQSGATLSQLQPEDRINRLRMRVLPNDLMLMVAGATTGKKTAVATAFDRRAYETAAKAARSATAGAVATLPVDRSGVKTIAQDANPVWAVTADPATAKGPFASAISLATPGQVVHEVLTGAPESAQAATLSIIEVKTPYLHSVLRWDRYDLISGRHLGTAELGTVKKPPIGTGVEAALSPKGERIAICNLEDPNRIDLWSGDGKSLGGFCPANGSRVDWFAFLAEDKLLALAGNQLTLWEVPAFKAIYETTATYRGIPALSPNRRWLAVCNGGGTDVIEAATGACRGRIAAGGDATAKQNQAATAAFSLDGGKLAVVVATSTGGGTIVVSNVATGKSIQTIQTTMPRGKLQWCAQNYLLEDSSLIDLESNMLVWNYSMRGLSVRDVIDGRYWHVENGPGNTVPGKLLASTIPEATVARTLASIKQPGTQTLLGPGAEITIQMNMAGPGDANYAKDLTAQLTQYLGQRTITVRNGAPSILTVNATVEATKDMLELKTLGPNMVKKSFPLKKLTVSMSLTDKDGRSVWQEKRIFNQAGNLRIFKGDDDPEKILAIEMWNSCRSWVTSPQLPSRVYLAGGSLVVLPGSSPMNADH